MWPRVFDFVFYYPLVMSALWMGGALLFYFTREYREPRYQNPVRRPDSPPVSVLIPCYNEGANVEETLQHA
ncbi:MAG: poly-beta-1,6 N-acetyl-D-glucosamine synthase, partial [Gammaproteobacteria bacterium]|nr:poly-beta-1,6 N-acetyl-D-glucosamine synthase [Gammaproteobacteria bacterium]